MSFCLIITYLNHLLILYYSFQCVAFAAVLAVTAAKPSLDYTYSSYVAPIATSYSAYPAPVYSQSVYSHPVYSSLDVAAPIAHVATAPVAPVHTTYAAAPVAAVATAPVATYAGDAYPAYSSYSAPLTYTNEISSFLWKKK